MSIKDAETKEPQQLDEFVDGDNFVTTANPEYSRALMENIYQLETDLVSEKEERREERFYWLLVVNIFFAVIVASSISFMQFLMIFLLQLVVLLGFAQTMGVDWAVRLLGPLFYKLSGLLDRKDD